MCLKISHHLNVSLNPVKYNVVFRNTLKKWFRFKIFNFTKQILVKTNVSKETKRLFRGLSGYPKSNYKTSFRVEGGYLWRNFNNVNIDSNILTLESFTLAFKSGITLTMYKFWISVTPCRVTAAYWGMVCEHLADPRKDLPHHLQVNADTRMAKK